MNRVIGDLSVAAVIPTWDEVELTLQAVVAVRTQVDHVFIVDNGSSRATRDALAAAGDDDITILRSEVNRGYAGGCNIGLSAALAAGFGAVLLMNNDAFPDPGSVARLRERLKAAPDLAAVGPLVVRHGTREVLHASCVLNRWTGTGHWTRTGAAVSEIGACPIRTDYISGEAMLIRRAAIEGVGLLDERYFCYYEDTDWGLRARRLGWQLEVVPGAVCEHVVSATSSGEVGVYYRARNTPIFLRIALGHRRPIAFLMAGPRELLMAISLIRRRDLAAVVRSVLPGWVRGSIMRL